MGNLDRALLAVTSLFLAASAVSETGKGFHPAETNNLFEQEETFVPVENRYGWDLTNDDRVSVMILTSVLCWSNIYKVSCDTKKIKPVARYVSLAGIAIFSAAGIVHFGQMSGFIERPFKVTMEA